MNEYIKIYHIISHTTYYLGTVQGESLLSPNPTILISLGWKWLLQNKLLHLVAFNHNIFQERTLKYTGFSSNSTLLF
jgi:hypothetical protein